MPQNENISNIFFYSGFSDTYNLFLLPIFLGRAYHYDATQIGMLFIPGSLLTMAMMPLIGKLMQSGKNPKVMIIVGFIGLELCLMIMSTFSPQSSKNDVLMSLYMRGFALSFLFVPINSSILSQFTGRSLGQVAGLLNLFRQIGGSVGIAFVATLLNYKSHQNYLDLSSKINMFNVNATNYFNQTTQGLSGKFSDAVGFTNRSSASLQALYYKVQNQVFMMTFLQLVYVMMIILCFAVIPLYRLKLQKGAVKVVDAH
jgi:DHA2 family multidrug resistance protein